MKGGIFLIQDDDSLVEMHEQGYESEDLLQALLEKYPNLLAGDQIDIDFPREEDWGQILICELQPFVTSMR